MTHSATKYRPHIYVTRMPSPASSVTMSTVILILSPRTKSRLNSDSAWVVHSCTRPTRRSFDSVKSPQLPSASPGSTSVHQGESPTTIFGVEPIRSLWIPISGRLTLYSIATADEEGRSLLRYPLGDTASNVAKGFAVSSEREVTKSLIGRLHWNKAK